MSTCLAIEKCIQCSSKDPSKCVSCFGSHSLNRLTNTCECNKNPPCQKNQICISTTGECVSDTICLTNPFCESCSRFEPHRCRSCLLGFNLVDGQCFRLPCESIKNCISCDFTDPTKCASCGTFRLNSGVCECVRGSKVGCATNEVCTPDNLCHSRDSCLTTQNCVKCRDRSPNECEICQNGFVASRDGTQCIQATCADKNCLVCQGTDCEECQTNLNFNSTENVCECVPGSKTGCEAGFECVKQDKICVQIASCAGVIENCESCWYEDERLCNVCKAGFVRSVDRKSCVAEDACKQITGCKSCVKLVPSVCDVCDGEIDDFGRSCGREGEVVGLSTGGIVGIIIAVLVVLTCGVVGIACGMKKVKKSKQVAVLRTAELPRKDFI